MQYIHVSPDAPLEIQHTVSRMNACRQQIEDLTNRLKAAESLWGSLRDEIAGYIQNPGQNAAVATRPVQSSLNLLPDELLCDIFQRLRFQRNANLGPLLLVNKRIHCLVMNTPSLWTRIEFHVVGDLIEEALLHRSYVEACMERSQNVCLDIDIKLDWDTKQRILTRAATDAVMGLVDDEEEAVWSAFDTMDMDFNFSVYEEEEESLFEVLDAIVGAEGCNMPRWKSLVLSLPRDDSQQVSILERLIGDTPNLRDLNLQNAFLLDADDEIAWEGVLPNLSALCNFQSDGPTPSASSLNPFVLQEIGIHIGHPSGVNKLSSYQALQYLSIVCFEGGPSGDPIISLPQLRSLHLGGSFNYFIGRLRTSSQFALNRITRHLLGL
ncbi:SubName: Full=Uncharacterized protein {ECO:0000313/EMBL:CCA75419.1} [Serendipita indica DSM 11827]|nr:SubName: Full=Uncharacterized protein {ECO:0000313/EMBL:CCA75419.1} [Serendipita indica DSM 11827]